MLRPQLQQHGEEPDTFKVKGLCLCNSLGLLESHGTFLLSTEPYSVRIKTILVLTLEIHSCMCLCVFKQPPDVGMHSCWLALWQMLNASVGLGAAWGRVRGYVFTYVEIHICTRIYLYMHICICLYVSNVKNTVHLVVLVYTLIWLNKTLFFKVYGIRQSSKDSVCKSSAVVVDLLRTEKILH